MEALLFVLAVGAIFIFAMNADCKARRKLRQHEMEVDANMTFISNVADRRTIHRVIKKTRDMQKSRPLREPLGRAATGR